MLAHKISLILMFFIAANPFRDPSFKAPNLWVRLMGNSYLPIHLLYFGQKPQGPQVSTSTLQEVKLGASKHVSKIDPPGPDPLWTSVDMDAGINSLCWVLQDKHTTQGCQKYDCDHTELIHLCNGKGSLIRKKIPGLEVTKSTGIANILTWHSTWQGSKNTHSFLNSWLLFAFESLDECIMVFDDSLKFSLQIVVGSGLMGNQAGRPPFYLCLDSPAIYSQFSKFIEIATNLRPKAISR